MSKSSIWEEQRKAYEDLGVYNFAPGFVPFQITNNARIARDYAKIIKHLFKNKPFTILEFGGGSGRFAYLLLKELEGCNVRYLLTDIAEKNVLFWQSHPFFEPWIKEGKLQTFVYDPLTHAPLQEKVDLGIANYVFDAIPNDLFRGKKEAQNPYPEFPKANEVFKEYRKRKRAFLFPIGALKLIESFQGKYLLIADRGEKKLEHTFHGKAFSFPVNFDVIERFVKKRKGEILFAPSSQNFVVSLISKGKISSSLRNVVSNLHFGPLLIAVRNLADANWDPIFFFSVSDQMSKEDVKKVAKKVEERFFPIFRQEAMLFERLNPSRDLSVFKNLPVCSVIAPDLLSKNLGSVFQTGKAPSFFQDIISSCKWESLNENISRFDTIFFFPPPFRASSRKPPIFIREIEEKFSFLANMKYSDQDIEEFLGNLKQFDSHRVILFFVELESRGNISRKQLQNLQKRFGVKESRNQMDSSFLCDQLDRWMKHLKKRGTLYALVFGFSPSDDPKIMEKYIVNPFISYEEKEDGNGTWLKITEIPSTS